MNKKSIAIPILVILLILTGSMLNEASAAPAKPPIVMDGGIETAGVLPPGGVDATDGTYTDQISISWDSVYEATYYEVYRNTTNESGSSGLLSSPSSSPYSDTTASPGVLYYYWVRACNHTECSSFSSVDSGYRAITPPTGVSASDGFFVNWVEITWSTSPDAIYYEIWRNITSNTAGASLLPGSPATPPYQDTTANPGTLYYYFVKGCGTAGCSAFSSSDSGYRALTAPTGVLATDGTYTDKVEISWSASTGTTFEIWRNTTNSTGGASKLPGSPSSSPYQDTTADPGILYYYFVKGCGTAGCSAFSSSDSGYRALTAPTGVSATDDTYTDKVVISWSAVTGATYYEVWRGEYQRSDSGIETTLEKLPGEPTTSPYEDTSAIPGLEYAYMIKACSDTGCSDFSDYDIGSRDIAMDYKIYLPLILN